MNIHTLRKLANREEIDYLFLMDALQIYARPREKVSAWLKSGELIRVKKGLYVFGKVAAKEPYSPELLANLIYGPSAISLTYALSIYGLIPDRVSTITCITNKKNKEFITPIGSYVYHYLNSAKYSIGLDSLSLQHGDELLITTPEKALCDQIHLVDNSLNIINDTDMKNYLLHDLRIEEDKLKKLDLTHLIQINQVYKNLKIELLITLIKKITNHA